MAVVPCLCPSSRGVVTHPGGDTITLAPVLTSRQAATIMHSVSVFRMNREGDPAVEEILAVLTEAYVKYGVASWTLQDADGRPIPVNPGTVTAHLVADVTAFMLVGAEADDLYSEAILVPLIERASSSSPDTPTTESTSAPTGSSETPPTPLRPSWTSTIPTGDTETTTSSPAGDSSSSPSLVSAG